jgi:hypothetical protein
MPVPMRRLLALAVVAGFSALGMLGCGSKFPLPTENREGRGYSSDNSYQMVATWKFNGGDSIADILLTQGSGSQLFLLFNHAGSGLGPRGAVHGYALKAKPPTPPPLAGINFPRLFVPAALAASRSHVFVLDQGDTCMARLNPETGTCTTDSLHVWDNKITDLASYWHVREYGLLGGDTLSCFTDTSLAYVRGIAVDAQERVYVSGSVIVLLSDPQDARIKTRILQFRVNRYLKVTPGTGNDPYMPGTDRWVRDQNYIVEEGSGLGTLSDPRGLYWSPGALGGGSQGLFAADFGKNWVQKLSDAQSSTGQFLIDADSSGSNLNGPVDVATDLASFIYLTDTGKGRVLRYDPLGQFVQRVDVEKDSDGRPLVVPIAVAADDSLVYVGDRDGNRVIRYQRRK